MVVQSKETAARLRLGQTDHGQGVFATESIARGEVILRFAGVRHHRSELPIPYDSAEDRYLQIEQDHYLGPSGGIDDFVNHSCNPNAGVEVGVEILLRAIRSIAPGEEITFDYSTTMDEDDWELMCCCGSAQCRGVIQDFKKLPAELQERYRSLNVVPKFLRDSHEG